MLKPREKSTLLDYEASSDDGFPKTEIRDTVRIFILAERMNIYAGSTRSPRTDVPDDSARRDEMERCVLQFHRFARGVFRAKTPA